MDRVLPQAYHARPNLEATHDPNTMSIMEFELLQIQEKQKEEALQMMGPSGDQIDQMTRAVQMGNMESLLTLQNHLGTEVTQKWRDSSGRGLLHFAAFYANPASLSGLRQHGYDVDATTSTGDTAVHIACYQGSLECLKLLHKWGCSLIAPNKADDRPSHKAAIRGQIEILA